MMVIKLLVAIFLEKQTKKHNKNSSKPSSQTEKDESYATTKQESNNKGKPESLAVTSNTRTIETASVAKVEECPVCGEDLRKVSCVHTERRTKIDIIFEKVIEHVDAEVKICSRCDEKVKAKFPEDMPGPLNYGNGIKAYAVNLLSCQMISLNRVQKLLKSMIGEVIAESTLLKFIFRVHQALETWELKAKDELLKKLVIHVDETSLRVDKRNQWIHVYSSDNITLKFLHQKRGIGAIETIDIIPKYSGTIIHDCWRSYLSYEHCGHGLCGSHLVRELTHAIESNNYQWAKDMKDLLLKTCKKVSKNSQKRLSLIRYDILQKSYRKILEIGEKELPIIPDREQGQRGKIGKSEAHNLWERLKAYEDAVLLFAKKSEVSFTNNRAERDLRMSKVKQKVSGCFRKEMYAQAYCRISSYLQTMANKGYNPLIAIQMALAGEKIYKY
jgi:hypothetical protein